MRRTKSESNQDFEQNRLQSESIPEPDLSRPGLIISPDTLRSNRIPEGQSRTKKWPVLDAFGPPDEQTEPWRFEVFGLVEAPITLNWETFQALPRTEVYADMHCVTRWSRLGNNWSGVSSRTLVNLSRPLPAATHVMVYAYDGNWTTNVSLPHFIAEDVLFADLHDGAPITLEHGGPLRLVVPRLFAWKSAKWVRGIEFMEGDKPGFWERGGYHMNGDPWNGERFRSRWT